MLILRILGGVFALIVAFIIALITKIEYINIISSIAFILAVDVTINDILSKMYLKAVYEQLEVKVKEKNNDDTRN